MALIIHEFPSYKMSDLLDIPILEFFLLVSMASDSSTRFGIGAVMSALGGVKKNQPAIGDNRTDMEKLASIGIPVL